MHKQHFLSRVKPTRNNYIPIAVQERIKTVHNRHGIRGGFCCNYSSSGCGRRSLYLEENLPWWWPTISEVWPTFCFQRGSFGTDGRGKIANRTTSNRWNTAKKTYWLSPLFIHFLFFASIKSSRQYFFLAVLERLQLHSVCSARACLQQCFVICFRMCRPIASVFWKLMSMAQQDEIGKDGPTATTQWNTLNNELWNSNLVALLRLRIL